MAALLWWGLFLLSGARLITTGAPAWAWILVALLAIYVYDDTHESVKSDD